MGFCAVVLDLQVRVRPVEHLDHMHHRGVQPGALDAVDHLHNPPTGRVQARVTYVDSCHLRHGQKVSRQPRALLRSIAGLELVELNQPDMCCGSAGIYNLLQPAMANEVLDRKLADVRAANAGIIVTANTGCYMQMVYGVKRAGLNATVMHVVEVLDRAYANMQI